MNENEKKKTLNNKGKKKTQFEVEEERECVFLNVKIIWGVRI